jgi:formate dehydrogenase major subunit
MFAAAPAFPYVRRSRRRVGLPLIPAPIRHSGCADAAMNKKEDFMKRRTFLRMSCCLGAGLALSGLGLDVSAVSAFAADIKKGDALKMASQSTTICCYCSVGCGLICSVDKATGKIFNIEGDPEHPINEGALCAKGAGLFQVSAANGHRLTKVLYRKPGGDKWEEKDWNFAITRIAELMKTERDKSFIAKNAKGEVVNRVQTMSLMGSSNVLSEECWATAQFARGLGMVYIDHQARV